MTVLDWCSEEGQRNAQEAQYIISGCLQTLTRWAKDPLVSVYRAPGKETLTHIFHIGATLNFGGCEYRPFNPWHSHSTQGTFELLAESGSIFKADGRRLVKSSFLDETTSLPGHLCILGLFTSFRVIIMRRRRRMTVMATTYWVLSAHQVQ